MTYFRPSFLVYTTWPLLLIFSVCMIWLFCSCLLSVDFYFSSFFPFFLRYFCAFAFIFVCFFLFFRYGVYSLLVSVVWVFPAYLYDSDGMFTMFCYVFSLV